MVVGAWLSDFRAGCDMEVQPGRLVDSTSWKATEGRIAHRSGGFFSVVGVQAHACREGAVQGVVQPIIDQPEIGLLGFLTHQREDTLEILAQAKPEPGNVGVAQLAPTVQATQSNYRRLHGGRPTVLLDAFSRHIAEPPPVRVRQSEQGSRFLGKYNENVIARLTERLDEPSGDFRWFPVDDVLDALLQDFVVNTDARSVLVTGGASVLVRHREPYARDDTGPLGELLASSHQVGRAAPLALLDAERRLEDARARFRFELERIDLERCRPWVLDERGLTDPEGEYGFVHVAVTTSQREVPAWDQPLATTSGVGESTLVGQWHGDRLRFLFILAPEVGFQECVQVHPTVQRAPGPALRGRHLDRRDELLAEVAAEAVPQVRVRQSDEGGRFLHCVGRYTVSLLPETTDVPELADTAWLSLDQIETLARRTGFFTNEARSVLSLLLGLA